MLFSLLPFISQCFAQHFALQSCWIHVEFMLSSSWIQANPLNVSDSFAILAVVFEKSQIIFLIVYDTNNRVQCLKCHLIGKFRYFAPLCLNSAWIQHERDTIVMQSVARSIVKLKVQMKSTWIQHEVGMNSTPACHSHSKATAPTKFEPSIAPVSRSLFWFQPASQFGRPAGFDTFGRPAGLGLTGRPAGLGKSGRPAALRYPGRPADLGYPGRLAATWWQKKSSFNKEEFFF